MRSGRPVRKLMQLHLQHRNIWGGEHASILAVGRVGETDPAWNVQAR